VAYGYSYTGLLLVLIPVAIIGGISKFRPGSSTKTQRAVLMTWLGVGQFFGAVLSGFLRDSALASNTLNPRPMYLPYTTTEELWTRLGLPDNMQLLTSSMLMLFSSPGLSLLWITLKNSPEVKDFLVFASVYLLYGVPSIWGFIIVAQMFLDYGNCIRVY
jgi:hypothetical protein